MSDAEDFSDTIEPKSDQLGADDLLTGPITVTVTGVRRGDRDQPVAITIEGRRPYLPCKSMRRVLIALWGVNGHAWVGRQMTLYRDPTVKWGGVEVGGIRISHLSHIDREASLALTVTRGKKAPFVVKPLVVAQKNEDAEYLRDHPDKEAVKATRRELFGDTNPLARDQIAELADALRAQEGPDPNV